MQRCRAARRVAPVILVVVVAGGCNLIKPLDPSLGAAFLTTDRADDYGITIDGAEGQDEGATSAAPVTNEGGNTRVAFWSADGTASTDQQSCISWTEGNHGIQQGLALRIRSAAGRTTAVTVTKNVWGGVWWTYNVHVMDSASTERVFVLIGSVTAEHSLIHDGVAVPGPTRLCAQVVGDVVSVKAWPTVEPEPVWGDGVAGGALTLPAGWDAPGIPGWYVGHLSPGWSTTYTDRTAVALDADETPPTTGSDVPSTTAPTAGAALAP